MSSLVLPILQGTLPGFPYAAQPSALESFIVILGIPLLIAGLGLAIGMGRYVHNQQEAGKELERSSH